MSPTLQDRVVVGVDFGTLSGRAVVVRVSDGYELANATHPYRHGVVVDALPGRTQTPLPPEWALQVPDDYRDVLRFAVPAAIDQAGIDPANVVGLGTDFTACTMVPTTGEGTPLCELSQFAECPHAYAKLWRHHAAQPQADRINELAAKHRSSWLPRYGGLISSEWEFAKALQILEEDPELYARIERWVEAADWIVWQLTGRYVRNACSAGYKGILQDGAYPDAQFLAELHPDFASFATDKLQAPIGLLGEVAGHLCEQAARWTGLPAGIPVAVGNVDAHVTAAAADALEPGQLVAIIGTSTCHIVNCVTLRTVPGMCGVVDGGVVAGLWGYEAGQSGVGDIFAHFVDRYVPAEYAARAAEAGLDLHEYLSVLAAAQPVGGHGLIALDWHSGNRSVLVDHELSGLLVGETLATRPEDVYRALIEATAFGTRTIIDSFVAADVPITEFIAAGGLSKSPLVMQIYADVTAMPVSVVGSQQAPALGAAIHAAVAAGCYPDVRSAAARMGRRERARYVPDPDAVARYELLYREYRKLYEYFGRGGNDVMRRLREIAQSAVTR